MYLHKDKELFREVIYTTADALRLPVEIVEKDYYVTMILKLLAQRAPECVFKGGTSLSKCHHVINRFSEDIDISFSDKLTEGQRKKLKNDVIANISTELELPIIDWEKARSKRDYNCYTFSYEPLEGFISENLRPGVKMETALGAISYPTVSLPVGNYVYEYLKQDNMDLVEEYALAPFEMRLQSLERTLIDKVFAICDYYLTEKINRNSRHIYDIYMLLSRVVLDESFKELVQEIRLLRADMPICPSAKQGVNVPELLRIILSEKVYQSDYHFITSYFQNEPLSYDIAITAIEKLVESEMFAE